MEIIKLNIEKFKKDLNEKLIQLLRKYGNEIELYEFNSTPSIGSCTIDTISLDIYLTMEEISISASDESSNQSFYAQNLGIEKLIEIIEFVEEHEDDIRQKMEDETTGNLASVYWEIFDEENGQSFNVKDLGILLDKETLLVSVRDDINHFALLDEKGNDWWDKLPLGKKKEISLKVLEQTQVF